MRAKKDGLDDGLRDENGENFVLNLKFNSTTTTTTSTSTTTRTTTSFIPTTSTSSKTTYTTTYTTTFRTTTTTTATTTIRSTQGPSETTTSVNDQETTTVSLTTDDASYTSTASTNPNVTDSTLSKTDKILIGILVPIGIILIAGAAYLVYSRCLKAPSVAPIADNEIDLESQSDATSFSSEKSGTQSENNFEESDGPKIFEKTTSKITA